MSDEFSFALAENKIIVPNIFNSSFSRKCKTLCKYELGRPGFALNTELMIMIMRGHMVT